MQDFLPTITRSGIYDSGEYFPGIKKTPLRTVAIYELELFLDDGGITHLNGKDFPIKKNSLLLARPGDKRQSTLHFRCLFLHFTLPTGRLTDALTQLPSMMHPSDPERIAAAMRDISGYSYGLDTNSPIRAAGALITCLADILREAETPAAFAGGEAESLALLHVREAERFIGEHFAKKLTLADIATHCHLSPIWFHTIFTRITGITPHEKLLMTRLSAARHLLITTGISLSDIAADCGFGTQAYLCQCFRRTFGITPGAFRKSARYPR